MYTIFVNGVPVGELAPGEASVSLDIAISADGQPPIVDSPVDKFWPSLEDEMGIDFVPGTFKSFGYPEEQGLKYRSFDITPEMQRIYFRYMGSPMVAAQHMKDISFFLADEDFNQITRKVGSGIGAYGPAGKRPSALAGSGNWQNVAGINATMPDLEAGTYYLGIETRLPRPVPFRVEIR